MSETTSELLPLLYDKLKELAGRYMRRERAAIAPQSAPSGRAITWT